MKKYLFPKLHRIITLTKDIIRICLMELVRGLIWDIIRIHLMIFLKEQTWKTDSMGMMTGI